jgi:hypothetical protein
MSVHVLALITIDIEKPFFARTYFIDMRAVDEKFMKWIMDVQCHVRSPLWKMLKSKPGPVEHMSEEEKEAYARRPSVIGGGLSKREISVPENCQVIQMHFLYYSYP